MNGLHRLLASKFGQDAPKYPFAQPGDIFFARGTDVLGRVIRWAERSKGEEESWCNHVGGVLTPGYLVPPASRITALAVVTEALWHVEEHVWWNKHCEQQGYAIAVFRPRKFTGNAGVERVLEDWHSRKGNKYGWWRLFTFLTEKVSNGYIPATKLHFQNVRVVCSNHIALGLKKDSILINSHDPNELDPDKMMDYSLDHPEDFKFVGHAIVPARRIR